MKIHEAALLFPIDKTNIKSLAEDIKANGLLVPIEVYDGKVIDGRRRMEACKIAKVKPDFYAKGTDYNTKTLPERSTLKELNIKPIFVGDKKSHATSKMIQRIRKRKFA